MSRPLPGWPHLLLENEYIIGYFPFNYAFFERNGMEKLLRHLGNVPFGHEVLLSVLAGYRRPNDKIADWLAKGVLLPLCLGPGGAGRADTVASGGQYSVWSFLCVAGVCLEPIRPDSRRGVRCYFGDLEAQPGNDHAPGPILVYTFAASGLRDWGANGAGRGRSIVFAGFAREGTVRSDHADASAAPYVGIRHADLAAGAFADGYGDAAGDGSAGCW